MKTFETIDNIFDVEPTIQKNTVIEIDSSENVNEKDEDFQLARRTLRGLIAKNEDVLGELVHLAKNSESPRTYEVAGQLLKTQSEIAKELMIIHKQKKDIDGESVSSVKNQTNNVFVGSTSDLMRLINNPNQKIDNEPKE
jgi:hypothetical protein